MQIKQVEIRTMAIIKKEQKLMTNDTIEEINRKNGSLKRLIKCLYTLRHIKTDEKRQKYLISDKRDENAVNARDIKKIELNVSKFKTFRFEHIPEIT